MAAQTSSIIQVAVRKPDSAVIQAAKEAGKFRRSASIRIKDGGRARGPVADEHDQTHRLLAVETVMKGTMPSISFQGGQDGHAGVLRRMAVGLSPMKYTKDKISSCDPRQGR